MDNTKKQSEYLYMMSCQKEIPSKKEISVRLKEKNIVNCHSLKNKLCIKDLQEDSIHDGCFLFKK